MREISQIRTGRGFLNGCDMPLSKGYERMNELASQVQQALRELEAGRLDLGGLDLLTEDARALYERLVILRHKAREAAAREQQADTTEAQASIRLDTRPADALLRQTSLIDAIAETERQEPSRSKPTKKPSLGDRMEQAPITDLARSITLSDKFWFVAELFGGEKEKYDRAIKAINSAADLQEAEQWIEREVVAVRPAPPAENVLAAFMDLVQRRFR